MLPELLACGGELKNVFCLTKGTHAILSQHIGDLENYETLVFFEETLANLKKLFRVTPRAVAYDLHPGYLSTKYALELEGAGEDRRAAPPRAHRELHGGERLDGRSDRRGDGWHGVRHWTARSGAASSWWRATRGSRGARTCATCRWPAATRRCASRGGRRWGMRARRSGWRAWTQKRLRVVQRMIETGTNTVMTSSCGRLFDAVAALIGLRYEVNFEGQAAIELEAIADASCEERYEFEIGGEDLDFRPMMERIVKETAAPAVVAARFHNTLAEAIHEMCLRMRRESGLNRVCLSGGTFQNMRLLGLTARALRASGFDLFLHRNVPPNDGGIALGQAVIAAARMK